MIKSIVQSFWKRQNKSHAIQRQTFRCFQDMHDKKQKPAARMAAALILDVDKTERLRVRYRGTSVRLGVVLCLRGREYLFALGNGTRCTAHAANGGITPRRDHIWIVKMYVLTHLNFDERPSDGPVGGHRRIWGGVKENSARHPEEHCSKGVAIIIMVWYMTKLCVTLCFPSILNRLLLFCLVFLTYKLNQFSA